MFVFFSDKSWKPVAGGPLLGASTFLWLSTLVSFIFLLLLVMMCLRHTVLFLFLWHLFTGLVTLPWYSFCCWLGVKTLIISSSYLYCLVTTTRLLLSLTSYFHFFVASTLGSAAIDQSVCNRSSFNQQTSQTRDNLLQQFITKQTYIWYCDSSHLSYTRGEGGPGNTAAACSLKLIPSYL